MDRFIQKSGGCLLLLLPTFALCLLGGVLPPPPFNASTTTANTVPPLSHTTTAPATYLFTSPPTLLEASIPSSSASTTPAGSNNSTLTHPKRVLSSPATTYPTPPSTTSRSSPPATYPSPPSTTSPSSPPATYPSPPSTTSTSSPPATSSSSPPTTFPASLHSSIPNHPPPPILTSAQPTPYSPPSLETSPSNSPKPQTSPPCPPPKAASLPQPTPAHRPMPPLPHTAPPLFERQPFIVSWNIPELVCNRYNVTLDNSAFKGVATPAKVPGQFLSLFYTDRLGLYPRVDQAGERQFNGGIPQRGNLRASLAKAHADIIYYIPSRSRRGLAVIDWEEWRPLWVRNWGSKHIYKTLSVSHTRQRNHSLTALQAATQAKRQFQAAARSFMSETLSLGRRLRPNYLWGFYLFPNCYNYGWLEPGYTGRCSREVRAQNDQLLWLWEASSALYPSVYLQASLGDSPSAALLVRNRVHEALRVAALPKHHTTAPVFVYTRPVFIDQNRRFLSQRDLVSTIGESAALGASGAVMWGASADYNNKPPIPALPLPSFSCPLFILLASFLPFSCYPLSNVYRTFTSSPFPFVPPLSLFLPEASCEALSAYLATTLNPYIANVTAAAQLCSNFLCQGNGRCVRQRYNSDHYLHLHPRNFRILHSRGRYRAVGRPSTADLRFFANRFTCQCYAGLTCSPMLPKHLPKALLFRHKQGPATKTKSGKKKATTGMEQSSNVKEKVGTKKQLKQ